MKNTVFLNFVIIWFYSQLSPSFFVVYPMMTIPKQISLSW